MNVRRAERAAVVHDLEYALQPAPDLVAVRLEKLVQALALQLFLQSSGREADAAAHVLGEHDEDQTVEQLLPEPYRPAFRHAGRALGHDVADQDLAIGAIILVKVALQLALGLALLLDQPLEPGTSRVAEQHVGAEQAPKEKPVETRLFVAAEQGDRIEQVAVADLEA